MQNWQAAYDHLDNYVKGKMETVHTPGMTLALTDREKCLRTTMYGARDLEKRQALTPETLFEIGSIGKTFTAVAVLQAQEAGLLDLHAPVTAYLPWFQVKTRHAPITIHHLLTHSAGLIRGTEFSPDPRAMVWALREMETGFPPGERCYYSDIGYKILGLVLQAVHDKTYAEVIHAGILEPLEMHDTEPAITHAVRPRLASGYWPLYDDRPHHPDRPLLPAPWLETDSGDGSIASTAGDMARFVRMLLNHGRGPNGPILSVESFDLMTQAHIAGEGWGWDNYGYGLEVFEENGRKYVGHGGDMPGYEARIAADLSSGYGFTLLSTHPYPPMTVWGVLSIFQAAYLDTELPPIPDPSDPQRVENAARYQGVYHSSDKTLALVAQGQALYLVHADEQIPLEARAEDRFYANHPDFDLHILQFGRAAEDEDAPVVEIFHGSDWYINERYQGPKVFDHPSEWTAYIGHYRSFNPWESNFRVFVRKGELLLVWPDGNEESLFPLGNGEFRVSAQTWSPERLRFDQVVAGQALRAMLSNCAYYRFFTP